MSVLGINHIAFRTGNIERLYAFYATLLDAERLGGEHNPLRAGAVLLVFFQSAHGGSRGFLVKDPDGRRVEIVYDNRSVYWREE